MEVMAHTDRNGSRRPSSSQPATQTRASAGAPLRIVVAITLPCALVAAFYVPLLLSADVTIQQLTSEDGPIESLGATALVVCAVFSLLAWRRRRDLSRIARTALLALTVLFVFGAGEEISWGQRILGLETPEPLRKVNAQGEINLHNLAELSGVFELDYAFRNFVLLFGALVPLLALWPRARRVLVRLVPIVPIWVAASLVVNQVLASVAERAMLASRGPDAAWFDLVKDSTVETKETAACLVLALGMYAIYRSLPLVPTARVR
jgi:hypothetical protein